MFTSEGRQIDKDHPLSEYPTPQFRRDSFFCLNGPWEFSLDQSEAFPTFYDRVCLVPYAVETPLSGLELKVGPHDILHYKKVFSLPEDFSIGRVLLHFEAVDQVCDVYLNGVKIAHHEGGYLPFTVDMLELQKGENVLQVEVKDNTDSGIYPRGKQSRKPEGIWYTATSGIWGTVWIESVPKEVIQSLRLTPLFDEKRLQIKAQFEGKIATAYAHVSYKGKKIATVLLDDQGRGIVDLSMAFHPWSPEHPDLYDLEVEINQDKVSSYFAMRKISKISIDGHLYCSLNNEKIFLTGVLDQGYYPDGGLTPPSDQAMINDIQLAKNLGFNFLRKHIKIEPRRFYYHCDRLGLMVFQDFVSGGAPYKKRLIYLAPFLHVHKDDTEAKTQKELGREAKKSRSQFLSDLEGTVGLLFNSPSIIGWTIFNEGWGQFDTLQCLSLLKVLDNTRLVDADSGWFDQGIGDFQSEHIYFRKLNPKNQGGRLLSISEFGGYSLPEEGHLYKEATFGYRGYKQKSDLAKGLSDLYLKQILPLIKKEGLALIVYTQLTDVEGEINGLITYDRALIKVDMPSFSSLNDQLKKAL